MNKQNINKEKVNKKPILKVLPEVFEKLGKKEKRKLLKILYLCPSFFFGTVRIEKNSVRLVIPVGKIESFFAKMGFFKDWFNYYQNTMVKLADLFLPPELRGWIEAKSYFRPGFFIFDYRFVEKDILRKRVEELINSYIRDLKSLNDNKKTVNSYLEIKERLIKDEFIDDTLLPLKEFKDIEGMVELLLSEKQRYIAICAYCKKPFRQKRKNQKYCKDSCRVMACRARNK